MEEEVTFYGMSPGWGWGRGRVDSALPSPHPGPGLDEMNLLILGFQVIPLRNELCVPGQPVASEPQFTPVAPVGSGGEVGLPGAAQRTEAAIPHVSRCPGSQVLPLEDSLLPPWPRSPQLLFRSPACCFPG